MRFGPPQCGVSVELPVATTDSVGWSTVSADLDGNVWCSTEEGAVYVLPSKDVLQWSMLHAEGRAPRVLPPLAASSRPLFVIEGDDSLWRILHGDRHKSHWSWIITKGGAVMLADATKRTVLCNNSIGAPITAAVLVGDTTIIVSTASDQSELSEVAELHYTTSASSSNVSTKARALFRLGDRVEYLCYSPLTVSGGPGVNQSVLSVASEAPSSQEKRRLLFTITERGNVDVWDLAAGIDATSEFNDLAFNAEALGAPTCACVVGTSLWIGTAFGPVVVCPLQGDGAVMCQVLEYHKAAITSIFPMTLETRVWSCCRDGMVAVWSVARLQPCGQFDIQTSSMVALRQCQPQLLTAVWGIDATHRAACWEVREAFHEQINAQRAVPTSTSTRGPSHEWPRFVASLCNVLTGVSKDCTFPTALVDGTDGVPVEARYLPDALMSLAECREMIFEVFKELRWPSVSLSEDVRLISRRIRGHSRAYQRAGEIAKRLSVLTPSFPLPKEVVDPVEQLLIAAECVLEEVADQGTLRDPNRSNVSLLKEDLDNSVSAPEARHVSEHIFETQLKALELQLAEERRRNETLNNTVKQLESDNDALLEEVSKAKEAQNNMAADVDRWRKAHVASKKRLASLHAQFDAERTAMAQELDTARAELSRIDRDPVATKHRLPQEATRKDSNRIVQELLRMLRRVAVEQRNVRDASVEVLEELAETKESFQEMEKAGKTMIHGLEQERIQALDLLYRMQQQAVESTSNHTPLSGEHVHRALGNVIAQLRGDKNTVPLPHQPLRVSF